MAANAGLAMPQVRVLQPAGQDLEPEEWLIAVGTPAPRITAYCKLETFVEGLKIRVIGGVEVVRGGTSG